MKQRKSKCRIWLNKNLSSTVRILELFRQESDSQRFELVCSHPDGDNPVKLVADIFEQEPGKSSCHGQDYVDYCLNFVRRNKIDLFVPGRGLSAIACYRAWFEELGVQVLLPGSAHSLAAMEHKDYLYDLLADTSLCALPAFGAARTLAEFEAHFERIAKMGHEVCFKPAVGVYGMGFHRIGGEGRPVDRFLSGTSTAVSLDEVRYYLSQVDSFQSLIVMQYLPGDERSIDCLAVDGNLRACVSRVKSQKEYQVLEDNPFIFEQARKLTAHLKLKGLFNIQFKDDEVGIPHLLEINARMSGGLPMACLSGFNFFYWAVKLAIEPDCHLPEPLRGLKVRDVSAAVLLN